MSFTVIYNAYCRSCNAFLSGDKDTFKHNGWKQVHVAGSINGRVRLRVSDGWDDTSADDCICKDCYDAYYALQEKADEAQQAAYDALGKFTPTPSPSGGSGTEDDPYTFQTGVMCVLNAFYKYIGSLYVYMPADATAKSYDSWDDAAADFVEWTE